MGGAKKEPLAALAGSQGLESAGHFLNHQKRSISDNVSTMMPVSIPIPPFPVWSRKEHLLRDRPSARRLEAFPPGRGPSGGVSRRNPQQVQGRIGDEEDNSLTWSNMAV